MFFSCLVSVSFCSLSVYVEIALLIKQCVCILPLHCNIWHWWCTHQRIYHHPQPTQRQFIQNALTLKSHLPWTQYFYWLMWSIPTSYSSISKLKAKGEIRAFQTADENSCTINLKDEVIFEKLVLGLSEGHLSFLVSTQLSRIFCDTWRETTKCRLPAVKGNYVYLL